MTYCAGVHVRDGLVMVPTRAPMPVSTTSPPSRKLHLVSDGPDRTLAICAAGNLSITQSTLSLLQEGVLNPETDEVETLHTVPTLFRAAQLIGRAWRKVYAIDGPALEEARISTDVTFLFGARSAARRCASS